MELVMGDEWVIPTKDLFEGIQGLRADFATFSIRLQEAQNEIQLMQSDMRQYNGLRGKLDSHGQRIEEVERQLVAMQAQAKGKGAVADGIRVWVPVIIGVAGFVFGVIRG